MTDKKLGNFECFCLGFCTGIVFIMGVIIYTVG